MRLRSICLLVVVMLLLVGPVAAVAGAGAGDRGSDEGWRTDARYWWEVWAEGAPLTRYQREQIGEITDLILDRYFGIEDTFVMSPAEFEKATSALAGDEKEWEALRLFGYYAQKRGFEVPAGVFVVPSGFEAPPGIPAWIERPREDAQEYVRNRYWWEWLGGEMDAIIERRMAAIIYMVAEAKGKGMCWSEVEEMCPSEVEERFGELFPGVDLRKMTLYEYDRFLNSLPQPPLRPVCFAELKGNPRIIALFGRVPPLSTEEELRKFDEKLAEVVEAAWPLLRKLPLCEFPFATIIALHGAIGVSVFGGQLPQAEVVYEILAEKAESLFGIKDVPVTFSNSIGAGRDAGPQASLPGPASPGWRPPWNEPFPRIPGGVKVSGTWSESTASFAVIWVRWWWFDDKDYMITGHKGPPRLTAVTERPTITPLNMRVYQPTSPQ